MAEFKEGDVVQLKSGGPLMTISGESDTPGYYLCTWFDDKNEVTSDSFISSILKLAEDLEPE